MTPKTLAILFAVTLVAVALAFWSARSDSSSTDGRRERGLLYPGLAERVEDIAAVEVLREGQAWRLESGERGWILASRGGFPVRYERVKQNLMSLVGLEIVEPKTRKPERYAQLGVEGPAPESSSTLLRVFDSAGEELAALIVGNPAQGGQVFVRREEDQGAYLCRGSFSLWGDELAWIERGLLDIDRERIARVEVQHPDGERLVVVSEGETGTRWILENLPEGRELTSAAAPNSIGTALMSLSFEGFEPRDEVDFEVQPGPRCTLTTDDGLVVELQLTLVDEQEWITLEARAAEDAGAAAVPEAEGLQRIFTGWAFRVPTYEMEPLRQRLEDLLAEPQAGPSLPGEDGIPSGGALDGEPVEQPTSEAPIDDLPVTDAPIEDLPVTEEPIIEDPPAAEVPIEDPPTEEQVDGEQAEGGEPSAGESPPGR